MALIVMTFEDGPEFRRMIRGLGALVEIHGDDPAELVEIMARTFGVEGEVFTVHPDAGHLMRDLAGRLAHVPVASLLQEAG